MCFAFASPFLSCLPPLRVPDDVTDPRSDRSSITSHVDAKRDGGVAFGSHDSVTPGLSMLGDSTVSVVTVSTATVA